MSGEFQRAGMPYKERTVVGREFLQNGNMAGRTFCGPEILQTEVFDLKK